MSDFFNKLGSALQQAASRVESDVNIASQEHKVKEAYRALGRLYYEQVRAGNAPEGPAFTRQMEQIDALLESIRQLRREQNVDPDRDFEA